MASLTESFTLQTTVEMRNALNQRAAMEERPVGSVVRRAIAHYLSCESDDEEITADTQTPELTLE